MKFLVDPDRLTSRSVRMPGPAEPPIREAFWQDADLHRLGARLAEGKVASVPGLEPYDVAGRTRQAAKAILNTVTAATESQRNGEAITPAAQWLLDNHYLIEDSILQIRRDLPRRFYEKLPSIEFMPGERVPRVLAIAFLYVAHSDSYVSLDRFEAIVEGFQSIEPLKIGELWALPSLLRFALIENLRRLALRVDRASGMRRTANLVADKVLRTRSEEDDIRILDPYAAHARETSFATQLLYRLRDGSQNAGRALAWLETELEKSGTDAEATTLREHATLSSGNVTTGNIVRGLRLVNDVEWTSWFERLSHVDRLMRSESDFATLDFSSRDTYRRELEKFAKRSGKQEAEVARAALDAAAKSGEDVGAFIVGTHRRDFEKALGYKPSLGQKAQRLYRKLDWAGVVVPMLVLTAIFVAIVDWGLRDFDLDGGARWFLLATFALPATEAALAFFNKLVALTVKPTQLIGYEFKDGIPDYARTLVVVPSLISSRDDIEDALRNIEVHYLSNTKGACHFALLSDWTDSRMEQTETDTELLEFARSRVEVLNRTYPRDGAPRFYLLHRRRLFNEQEGVWMGWERKRGKLSELNGLLRGDPDTTFLSPNAALPDDIRYVVTLDADTRMTRGAVAKLVGKMCHPMTRPVFDATGRKIVSGHAILQPRITPSLTTGDEASFFQRVFSANRGMDPYVFAASDVYQDLFAQGTFTGKGLYHVDAMEAALRGRIPENSVLSHDLLEGAYCRAGLVSDIELVEDYPTRYLVDASRHHRWTRGDWQLLPYIFGPSGVPPLSRWKMIDNLRRSIVPIAWVVASIGGWCLMPFTQAVQWQALLVFVLFFGLTFDLLDGALGRRSEVTASGHFASQFRDAAYGSAQVVLKLIFAAHNAWSMGDAIVRTLHRVFISRRKLLEWRTASQAARSAPDSLRAYFETMWPAPFLGLAGFALAVAADSTGAGVAAFVCVLWALSPAAAWFVSRSAETEDRLVVDADDATTLRVVARRTWHYYETFVTPEQNMLPPDNFQETPVPVVANRTSPTNIGVYLLSIVSARDFGWIGMIDAMERIEKTMDTMDRMERFRGHLYNWYETINLRPLLPLYISAVDSGNLAGHLIAVSAACRSWAEAPAAHLQGDFEGILDAARILDSCLIALPDDRRSLRPLRKRLKERIVGMDRAVSTLRSEPETSAIRTINLTVLANDIVKLASSLHEEIHSTASEDLAIWARKLAGTCEAHFADSHIDAAAVELVRRRLIALRDRTRTMAFEMDFSFLLREDRKLLSIGYRVADHQLDEACYDLLASEARLTSLFAVAKGDLPTEHWFRLGRPVTEIGFRGALVSWSGSMFEYLMPPLVMKEPQGGILNQTSRLIVKKQISYGRQRQVPWGISEAAYNARDRELTYQYTNFGVPGLGLKRGLAQNLVIAPYATILAAQFAPHEAVTNLHRLRSIGAMGRYGFYDAVDFTPSRVPSGERRAVVYNYFAHHHGMSIVAIANVVLEGRMRDRFHSDPVIEAAELLLQEKAPRDIPATTMRAEAAERVAKVEIEHSPDTRLILNPRHALPAVNLMSNGRYSVMVTSTGAGYSRFGDIAVTRWNADPTEERAGTFLFLTDTETGDWWSATTEPRTSAGETSEALFRDDQATFVKTVGGIRTQVECIVVSEGDGEARRITIINESGTERILELTSFAEIALAPEASDSAHPAFSKMFVETEITERGRMVFAHRRKRSSSDPDICLVHFMSAAMPGVREFEAETDRRAFIGVGRTIQSPVALDPRHRLTGSAGFTVDPAMAVRCRVRIPAGKKAEFTVWTLVANDREELRRHISACDQSESFQRQATMAWTRSQVQTRHVGLSLAEASGVQKLARALIFPDPSLRASADTIAAGLSRQSALWPTSISGDFPIFALRISDVADLEIVGWALRMQEYLRARGLNFDLVICNEQAASYVQDLQQATERLCENHRLRGHELGPRQHIFAVRRDLMDAETYRTLIGAARIAIHTRNGSILDQVERAEANAIASRADGETRERLSPSLVVPAAPQPAPSVKIANGDGLNFWNGYGGFADGGGAYVVRLAGADRTPQPWINVFANPEFGFHTSAEGASFTWSRNSRDFQLTPWSNDPVSNRPGEAIYIHDRNSGTAFSPVAATLRDRSVLYEARHEPGASTFTSIHHSIRCELSQVVDPADPVKVQRLVLTNTGGETARLRVYAYAEWVMGTSRAKTAPFIVPAYDPARGVMTARNPYSLDFSDRFAFLAGDRPVSSVTADRHEFLGAGGSVERAAAPIGGRDLSGSCDAGRDCCAALAFDIDVAPGGSETLILLLGDAGSAEQATALVEAHRSRAFEDRLVANGAVWNDFLSTLHVETPDPAFNALLNTWLPYQALACRIRARSAFYQASGAYGFRDQLQDTLALLLHDPSLARAQIINAASRQFREGDVMHWWLPRTGAGVRTMISDDVVWLAHAAHRYVAVTGDDALLDEPVAFVEGPVLKPGEHDAFMTPDRLRETAPLYEHCARALDLSIKRTGEHGLPLILGGDWNDGMNRVGEGGKGESIWLGWFLLKTLRDFASVAHSRGDGARADTWLAHASMLSEALETAGWDGDWYRRASYDDGTWLGSAESDECRIDSIAQSWSVLGGGSRADRQNQALDKVWEQLADQEVGLIRLFDPPFHDTPHEPGYIKSYPPGVRENGGQYTHAAIWYVIALAEAGRAEEAYRAFSMINPVNHALDRAAADRYRVEPYVVAADIYAGGEKHGRGGWTWYTGSAGWLLRAGIEAILGIRKSAQGLEISPSLPEAWPGFTATLKIGAATYTIRASRSATAGLRVDGAEASGTIPLFAGGEHLVEVSVPLSQTAGESALQTG